MFTGIVQKRGRILRIQNTGKQRQFLIQPLGPEAKLAPGESIAVDGVCLTVSEMKRRRFQVEAIHETLEATTLKYLKAGDLVNLERALRWGQPFGGHFVTGHVDGTGTIKEIRRKGKNVTLTLSIPPGLIRYLAPKGSVALDGISLTVQSCRGKLFTVGLVPYTLRATALGGKRKGDRVNIEVDLVARYLEKISRFVEEEMRPRASSKKIRMAHLKKQGF